MLTGALRQLFAVAEAYPDLKANTNFLELQRELSDIENKLAAARRFFNNAVGRVQRRRSSSSRPCCSPAMFGFGAEKPFFDVGDDRRRDDRRPAVGEVLRRSAWAPSASRPTSGTTTPESTLLLAGFPGAADRDDCSRWSWS